MWVVYTCGARYKNIYGSRDTKVVTAACCYSDKKRLKMPSEKLKTVSQNSPFGGSAMRDGLGLIMLPFVALAFILMTITDLIWYSVRLLLWPSIAPVYHKKFSGEQPIEFFDPDVLTAADWARLRNEYIERGVPFVLRRAGGAPLSDIVPPASAVEGAFASGCIRVAPLSYMKRLPGLDEIIGRLFPWSVRAYWPLWFLGKYTQGKAHVDLGPHVCNCYFLRKGVKDVLLIPPEVAKIIPLTPGLDGMYIEGSESEKREYRGDLPYYYRVDLPAQSMLCFNNTSTIHHYKNCHEVDGSTPEALSIRIRHCCCPEPRVWCHMTLPWLALKPWWRFTGVAVSQLLSEPAEERDAKYL